MIVQLKKTFQFSFCLSVLFLCSCASTSFENKAIGVGEDGKPYVSDLKFTWELNSELSSENFGFFNFSLTNLSDSWYRLTNVKIFFPDSLQNKNVKITLGEELVAWEKAKKHESEISQYNQGGTILLLTAVGIGIASLVDHDAAKVAGSALVAGAMGSLAVESFNNERDSIRLPPRIPSNHLLVDTILIPPGFTTQHWILLNSNNHKEMGYVDSFKVQYNLNEDRLLSNLVTLRKPNQYNVADRNWQSNYFKKYILPLKPKPDSQSSTVTRGYMR